MSRTLPVSIACILSCNIVLADEQPYEVPTCGDFDSTGLTEGKPVIRVNPVLGTELWEDGVDSCVVVVYGLKGKARSDGDALLAYRPKTAAYSDEVPRKARKAVERSLSKWLFLSKTHSASKDADLLFCN